MTHDRPLHGCGAEIAFAADGGRPDESVRSEIAALLEDLPDNWGRWGDGDERGTLNLLGGAEAAAGMRAALAGEASLEHGSTSEDAVERFALGLPITGEEIPAGAGPGATGDPSFPGREVARRDNTSDERAYREGEREPAAGMKFSDDRFVTPLYLHGTTHVDALGHAWYGDRLYNGFDAAETAAEKRFETAVEGTDGDVTGTRGLGSASVASLAEVGIAGRGVLLDVARHRSDADGADDGGDSRLPMGAAVTLEDLRETARAQGVALEDRDVLLVRTGSMGRTRDPDAEWNPTDEPGLVFSEALVEWAAERDVVAVGADNVAVERVTQIVDGATYVLPLHGAFLRNLGMPLIEMLWLDDLAAACAADGVYEFLFTAAPLNVRRATGGPANPLVLKATA